MPNSQSLKGTELFLLWHLKPSWPWIQQVGCSSAEGLVILGWGRDLAGAGEVGTEGLGRAKKGWRMGLGVNAKTINPTSAWPQVPIKFIYIFTLRPPLKRLCLDISKHRDVPIYLATKLSQRPAGSWERFIPPWPDCLLISSAVQVSLKGSCVSIYIIRQLPLQLGSFNLLHIVFDIFPTYYSQTHLLMFICTDLSLHLKTELD